MTLLFYINSGVAVLATVMVVTLRNPVHALLYFIASLIALALSFYALGAHFAAALEVIVYAGAIMVLFVFVVMLLNLPPNTNEQTQLKWSMRSLVPMVITLLLLCELFVVLAKSSPVSGSNAAVDVKTVAITLFDKYGLVVEFASFILLSALIGALHVGKKRGNTGVEHHAGQ